MLKKMGVDSFVDFLDNLLRLDRRVDNDGRLFLCKGRRGTTHP